MKKFFGCGTQQGNEKKDNFVDNSHVVGLNNNKHEDYNNYINNNNDLNKEEDDNFGNKWKNSNDDNNSDNEGGNSEDNNFGDNSNLNFAFVSNTPYVGKTSILHCLWRMKFDCSYKETVFTQYIKVTHKNACNNMTKEIFLWDTPGKEEYRPLLTIASSIANAIVFVYDVTNVESYVDLGAYIDQIAGNAPEGCLFFLLGNKLDLADAERQVTTGDAQKLAEKNKLIFLGECSAKNNTYEPAQKLSCEKVVLQDGKCTGGLSDMLNDIMHYIRVKTKIKVKKNM